MLREEDTVQSPDEGRREDRDILAFEGQHAFKGNTSQEPQAVLDDSAEHEAVAEDRDMPSSEGQKVFKGNTSQEPWVDE